MPTYVYECNKCKKRFEVIQSIKDDPLKKHSDVTKSGVKIISKDQPIDTDCDGEVKRIISGGSGIIFKGEGWTKPRNRSMKKIDSALGKMNCVDDCSQGWSYKD